MSMIARYKRSGGFIQLLSLVETSSATKQEKFLEIIESENRDWSEAIKKYSLSQERIWSWPDEVVVEIFKELPLRNMACALNGISAENKNRIMNYMSHSEKRKVEDEMGSTNANSDEFNGTMLKVLEITRKMITEGRLRPEKFDPTLEIPENIEDKLSRGEGLGAQDKKMDQMQEAVLKASSSANPSAEVVQLQKITQNLNKEVKSLREENRVLKEKLEQIRKIA